MSDLGKCRLSLGSLSIVQCDPRPEVVFRTSVGRLYGGKLAGLQAMDVRRKRLFALESTADAQSGAKY